MALSKHIIAAAFGQNVQIANAYIKVNSISGSKLEIFCTVTTYTENKLEAVKTQIYSFAPNMNGGNFIAQAYEHLKTLDEFKDAFSC